MNILQGFHRFGEERRKIDTTSVAVAFGVSAGLFVFPFVFSTARSIQIAFSCDRWTRQRGALILVSVLCAGQYTLAVVT